MLLARKVVTVRKPFYRYAYVKHRAISICHQHKCYQSSMMRTNVLGDFVDKFTNDVSILFDRDDEFRVDCKYIAYINCIIIICILIYMFLDTPSEKN